MKITTKTSLAKVAAICTHTVQEYLFHSYQSLTFLEKIHSAKEKNLDNKNFKKLLTNQNFYS